MLSCPFCGLRLKRPLISGIDSCNNCGRVFDDSRFNLILSSAWFCRKNHLHYVEELEGYKNLLEEDAKLIQKYVIDESMSHDQFIEMLRNKFNLNKI